MRHQHGSQEHLGRRLARTPIVRRAPESPQLYELLRVDPPSEAMPYRPKDTFLGVCLVEAELRGYGIALSTDQERLTSRNSLGPT